MSDISWFFKSNPVECALNYGCVGIRHVFNMPLGISFKKVVLN